MKNQSYHVTLPQSLFYHLTYFLTNHAFFLVLPRVCIAYRKLLNTDATTVSLGLYRHQCATRFHMMPIHFDLFSQYVYLPLLEHFRDSPCSLSRSQRITMIMNSNNSGQHKLWHQECRLLWLLLLRTKRCLFQRVQHGDVDGQFGPHRKVKVCYTLPRWYTLFLIDSWTSGYVCSAMMDDNTVPDVHNTIFISRKEHWIKYVSKSFNNSYPLNVAEVVWFLFRSHDEPKLYGIWIGQKDKLILPLVLHSAVRIDLNDAPIVYLDNTDVVCSNMYTFLSTGCDNPLLINSERVHKLARWLGDSDMRTKTRMAVKPSYYESCLSGLDCVSPSASKLAEMDEKQAGVFNQPRLEFIVDKVDKEYLPLQKSELIAKVDAAVPEPLQMEGLWNLF